MMMEQHNNPHSTKLRMKWKIRIVKLYNKTFSNTIFRAKKIYNHFLRVINAYYKDEKQIKPTKNANFWGGIPTIFFGYPTPKENKRPVKYVKGYLGETLTSMPTRNDNRSWKTAGEESFLKAIRKKQQQL